MKNLLFVIAILTTLSSKAQDFHLSQFYMSPLTLNPALTGAFNGNYRVSGTYRNQWESFLPGVSFKTFVGAADFSIQSGANNRLGIGINYFSDEAGSLDLINKQLSASLAYQLAVSKEKNYYIAAGIQGAYDNTSFNSSKITTGSQWPGSIFNSGPYPNPAFIGKAKSYVDINAGILFYHIKNSRQYQYIGLSAFHLNQPNISFIESSIDRLYTKYVLHTGADFKVAGPLDITPYIFAMLQGPDYEVNGGAYARYIWNEAKNNNSIYLGPLLRIVGNDYHLIGYDAIIIAAKLEIWRLTFGFSYDYNISGLDAASKGQGGPEFSIQYVGAFCKKSKEFLCPKF